MFKLLTIGVCLFLLYRMVFPSKSIGTSQSASEINQTGDVIDVDYEEVDE